VKRIFTSIVTAFLLMGCEPAPEVKPIEVLDLNASLDWINAFEESAWRGCDRGRYSGEREEPEGMYPFWVCEGVFENSYPYEFMIVTEHDRETVRYTQLEYRRGHNDSFYALLRYFLRLQGITDEQTRIALRSQVSSVIFSNPRNKDFTSIARLPDGRFLELAHNHPESAFSTLRVVNPR